MKLATTSYIIISLFPLIWTTTLEFSPFKLTHLDYHLTSQTNIPLYQTRTLATPSMTPEDTIVDLGLTPELQRLTTEFGSIADERTRWKQLMYMGNNLPRMDPSLYTLDNKVPGCVSTTYIDCSMDIRDDGKLVVNYVGSSDGLMTKGLVCFLVRGLSGCTPEDISKVQPAFIEDAKISQSLTPGRNNGFINMLAVMKKKAHQVAIMEEK